MDQEGIIDGRLRIGVRAGGCAGFSYDMEFDSVWRDDAYHPVLVTDPVDDTDVAFTEYGVTLISDKKSLKLLNGTEIDYVETLQSSGFKFNNPNASASCGCGQSFT
jgi:iron-sulfur cluster assembly accessory protein